MKYSIRGNIKTSDGSPIVETINNYTLWRLETGQGETFTFEAWVNTETDKTNLFAELKGFVLTENDFVDWHECTHDETIPLPCVIAEEYKGVN